MKSSVLVSLLNKLHRLVHFDMYSRTLCSVGILFILLKIDSAVGTPCVGTEFAGPSNLSDISVLSADPSDINATTLFANSLYTVPCCGVISSWDVGAENTGKVRLQVWRALPGEANTYLFLGQNGWEKTTPTTRIVTRNIPRVAQVQVNTGDFLALYHFDAVIVRYNTCDPLTSPASECSQSVYIASDIAGSDISEGYTYTFSTLQSTLRGESTIRNYAIKAYLSTKGEASCTNETKTISDTLATGSNVANISTENVDLFSTDSVFAIESMEPTIPVTINSQTGEITTTDALTPSYPSSTYLITVRVTDVCTQSNTCILTLTVTSDAQPVTFENLPASTDTIQVPDSTVDIYTVIISRQREIDDVACVIQSTSPELSDTGFTIQNISKTEYAVVMTTSSSDTQPDIDNVILTIYCFNNQGFSNQSTLTLSFTPEADTNNRFWIIGFLMAFTLVFVLLLMFVMLFATRGLRHQTPHRSGTRQTRQVKPDIIPAPVYVEPAKTSFTTVKRTTKEQYQTNRQESPVNTSNGFETSPMSSIGSDVTPTSISSIKGIGWVESSDESANDRVLTSTKKAEDISIANSKTVSSNFYFKRKPWRP